MNSVPEAYLGIWQRTLLRTSDGVEDRSTQVYWVQTEQVHADIRVPRPAPLTPSERAGQAGFAGITQVQGERCQWHRVIDFHPAGSVDIGIMHFVAPNEVHESAPDGAYVEIWERLPASVGANQAIWLEAIGDPSRQACLLRAGDYFIFAADREHPLQPDMALGDQLHGLPACEVEALLAFEVSFGRVIGDVAWQISLSTLPGRSGQCLVATIVDDNLQTWSAEQLLQLGHYPPPSGWQRVPAPLSDQSAQEGVA